MTGTISESIFSGKTTIIPMADVQHIEKSFEKVDLASGEKAGDLSGIMIITKHTCWNYQMDCWDNNIWLGKGEAEKFIQAWCNYRHEAENLAENGVQMP